MDDRYACMPTQQLNIERLVRLSMKTMASEAYVCICNSDQLATDTFHGSGIRVLLSLVVYAPFSSTDKCCH